MGDSLRDQLLKAGLATKKQVKATEQELREKARQKRKAKKSGLTVDEVSEQEREAARALAEKTRRDRERAEQQKEEQRRKELRAQANELIKKNALDTKTGTIEFNFVDGKRVKRVRITEDQRDKLARGRAAIVRGPKGYEIVPTDTANRLLDRLPEVVLHLAEPEQSSEDGEDPYAGYEVPDDLMW